MTSQKGWALKGTFYECCRTEGHCPLWFGRDRWEESCISFGTYQLKEGQIQNVDMKGIIIIQHVAGIGPKLADLAKGAEEGAAYISDNATDAQRRILEPFAAKHLGLAEHWRKCLGVKFVKIDISEENGTYHITMPFGEQKMSLTVGGDRKNPIRMENPRNTSLTNVKFCHTQFWKYHDYGKNLEFHGTSGVIADFAYQGEWTPV